MTTSSWANLLKSEAKKELSRLQNSSGDLQIKRALKYQTIVRHVYESTVSKPLISWTNRDQVVFEDWISSKPQKPVRFDFASGLEMWTPGDPVILTTDGFDHLGWIRPRGGSIQTRWLGFNVETNRINMDEVMLRDPRKVWGHSWLLQLGHALLLGEKDSTYRWLLPEPNTIEDPKKAELWQLYFEAKQELW